MQLQPWPAPRTLYGCGCSGRASACVGPAGHTASCLLGVTSTLSVSLHPVNRTRIGTQCCRGLPVPPAIARRGPSIKPSRAATTHAAVWQCHPQSDKAQTPAPNKRTARLQMRPPPSEERDGAPPTTNGRLVPSGAGITKGGGSARMRCLKSAEAPAAHNTTNLLVMGAAPASQTPPHTAATSASQTAAGRPIPRAARTPCQQCTMPADTSSRHACHDSRRCTQQARRRTTTRWSWQPRCRCSCRHATVCVCSCWWVEHGWLPLPRCCPLRNTQATRLLWTAIHVCAHRGECRLLPARMDVVGSAAALNTAAP
jgi:hypothetical protein